jgi:2-polyprenyl-3-methyl-5-hydroxy-6-metoxy-1,4-benzoquinol methylase
VCHAGNAVPFYGGLVTCGRCHHVWAGLDIRDDQLRELYRRNYFFGEEYTDYLADRHIIEKNFDLRLKTLRRFLDQSHRRLFEIGCAYGLFLHAVQSQFDTVEGIDISEDGTRHARERFGLDVHTGDLLTHDFAGREYDVVCLWDTIEHLKTPDLYIDAIRVRMRPGAVLAITTGDIASLNARVKRERWRLIHPPTHLHYFSRATLEQMLDRLGFDVVYSRHCGFYRSAGGMMDGVLRLRWGLTGLAEWVRRTPLARWAPYLNLYDIMYVIAVKRAV